MEYLPNEIIKIIYDFIPSCCKKNLSKNLFNIHYYLETKEKKFDKRYRNYIRYLINKNCILHIDLILHVFCGKFISIKNWKYKNKTYPNFLCHLKAIALNKNAQKCYELIKNLLDPSNKNKYKRIRTRNIRWSN
jgi:uncharacterized protein YfbU (UPF0304 family)